ncbi:MAG: sulfate permease [Bacteroidales bacterium]|nr:sulfate permease [Bacteroidales bacterium]
MKDAVFYPKLLAVLRKKGYSKQDLQGDLLAGIIVGIVALPLAIAFAIASGVSPEKGLITAVVAGFIISFLGGSRVQIGGPTGAFIVIVVGIIEKYGFDGLIISTILAGIILILFGLFRLGAVLKFIPYPLIVGFTSGIALIIFSSQVKDIFGLEMQNVPSEFIPKWAAYFNNFDKINYFALAIGLSTILITIYTKKILKRIPGSIIAILVMTALVSILKLPVATIETVFGEIPDKISLQMPAFDWSQLVNYLQPALTIAMLGAIESLLSAVVADGMISSNHRSNTELIAQGIANVVTPFFGGIPATGAIARTATNVKNGGRTPVAGMVHAIVLLLIMLFLGKWAKLIPLSCLAGILVVVAYNMSEMRSFVSILRGSRYDVMVLITTFLLTVLFDLTIAIEIGLVLAALLFMERMSKMSKISTIQENEDLVENYRDLPKGINVYEINGPFFFAAAKAYRETLVNLEFGTKITIIRMRNVPFIDSTGMHNFKDVIGELKQKHIRVILSGVRKEVYDELEKARVVFMVGKANVFDNFPDAMKHAYNMLIEMEHHRAPATS